MKRPRLIAAWVVSAMAMPCLLLPVPANAQIRERAGRDPLRIGIIQQVEFLDGAGCSLRLTADRHKIRGRYVFLSDAGKDALMNINGKDTRLGLVSRQGPEREPKKGDRSTWNYAAVGVKSASHSSSPEFAVQLMNLAK